jgi:hypothetical protein
LIHQHGLGCSAHLRQELWPRLRRRQTPERLTERSEILVDRAALRASGEMFLHPFDICGWEVTRHRKGQ